MTQQLVHDAAASPSDISAAPVVAHRVTITMAGESVTIEDVPAHWRYGDGEALDEETIERLVGDATYHEGLAGP